MTETIETTETIDLTEPITDVVAYGRQIAARRCAIGLKRKELALAAGISYPYIAEIENGKKMPTFHVQKALAAALNTPVAEIMAAVYDYNPAKALRGAPAPAPAAGEPTMADLMAEIRALRRLVEELMAR